MVSRMWMWPSSRRCSKVWSWGAAWGMKEMNGVAVTSLALETPKGSPDAELVGRRCFSQRVRPLGLLSEGKQCSALTHALGMQHPETRTTSVVRTGTTS